MSRNERIHTLSVTEDEDGNVSLVPELVDVILKPEERVAIALKKMSNGTLGGQSRVAQPVVPVFIPQGGVGVAGLAQPLTFSESFDAPDGSSPGPELSWSVIPSGITYSAGRIESNALTLANAGDAQTWARGDISSAGSVIRTTEALPAETLDWFVEIVIGNWAGVAQAPRSVPPFGATDGPPASAHMAFFSIAAKMTDDATYAGSLLISYSEVDGPVTQQQVEVAFFYNNGGDTLGPWPFTSFGTGTKIRGEVKDGKLTILVDDVVVQGPFSVSPVALGTRNTAELAIHADSREQFPAGFSYEPGDLSIASFAFGML